MNKLRIGVLFSLLTFAGCSHSPTPASVPPKEASADDADAHPGTIRVLCALYTVGGPGASSCSSISFALENDEGVEIARKNPDASGTLEFPVPAEKAFRVKPRVSGAWTIEWLPPGDLRAGDNVRIILRR